jgi:uncharacterized protein YjbI with pentapeptide repeats
VSWRAMTASQDVDWDLCDVCADEDGIGVRLPSGGKCWAHADDQDLDSALKRLREGGRLDVRGVVITQELLGRLLAAAPRNDHGRTLLIDAQFDRATFQGDVLFPGATFQGRALFPGATFQGDAWFQGATFQSDAQFEGATFQDEARFDRATFQGAADFSRATFLDTAWFGYVGATFQAIAVFRGATFKGDAAFDLVTFEGNAWFDKAIFRGRALFHVVSFQRMAVFREATFHRYVGFRAATFQSDTVFEGATFRGSALFDKATFQETRQLGPMLVRKSLLLSQAVFYQRAQIEIAAAAVCCQQARFPTGVQLRVRWAQVVLDDADFAAPSILSGVLPFARLDERSVARVWRRLRPPKARDDRPRLLSLRRADVAGLTISNVDLRACLFLGAHNLDKLRIEGDVTFGSPRDVWLARRLTIAEEHRWRILRSGTTRASWRGWFRPQDRPPAWLKPESVSPAQIAVLYRALRKGREDSKDEPGAADFYYGEMEMRRHARRKRSPQRWLEQDWGTSVAARSEYVILWLYWLTSGYGLRAWRALAAFLVLLVIAANLFTHGGFASSEVATAASTTATSYPAPTATPSPPPNTIPTADTSFGGALVYSARTVIGLTREPQPRLTRFGDVVQILLRILGPVLLGLAVLSVRGRAKR